MRFQQFSLSHPSEIFCGIPGVEKKSSLVMAYRLSAIRYRWWIWIIGIFILTLLGLRLNLNVNHHKLLLEQKKWEERVHLLQEEIQSLNKRLNLFTDYRAILEKAGRDLGMIFPSQPPDTIWIRETISYQEVKHW